MRVHDRGHDGQHDRAADLHGGLQDAGGQPLLRVGHARGGLDVQRGEAQPEGRADQQHRRQDHARVVGMRAGPQEQRVPDDQAAERHHDHERRAEPVQQPPHPGRGHRHQDAGRQERERGAQRRPARRGLQVLGKRRTLWTSRTFSLG